MRQEIDLRVLLATGASVFALGIAGTATAQDDVDTIPGATAAEVEAGDTITVTGSRIRRSEIDSTIPTFTFGAQTIEDRGFTNVADLLNQSPIFGGSLTPDGDQNGFTAGQNQVNLFDLGVERTLVLVNGRRLASSTPATLGANDGGGGSLDLNSIPAGLIERVETTPLLGAAVYGSDAIAGTVNIIMKDDFEGFEVRGQYGNTFDVEVPSKQVSFLTGTNFSDGRGNIVFSVEYTKDDGALTCERDFLCEGDPNLVNLGGQQLDIDGDGVFDELPRTGSFRGVFEDQVVQLFGPGGTASTAAVIPSFGVGAFPDGNIYQFDNSGNLQACEPGVTPPGTSAFFAQGGTCGVDFFNNVEQLRSPTERVNVFAAMNYDVTDNITFRQDFLYANTRGEELVNQGGFQTWAFGGTSAAITVDADNPFLNDQARGVLAANGVDNFLLNRFNNDIVGAGSNSNETHVFRISNVLEGNFEKFGRQFFWDISGTYAAADITTKTFGIVDGRFINAVDAATVDDDLLEQIRLQDPDDATDDLDTLDDALLALQGSNPTVALAGRGDVICGAFADLAAGTLEGFNARASGSGVTDEDLPFLDGCQPLNLFGAGAASPEALAFINGGTQQSQSTNEQTVYQANFGGDAFDLPAGTVLFNLGYESRREVSEFAPGMGSIVPITRSTVSRGIEGKSTTQEFYGEVNVPVISRDMNIPLVNSLEFDGAVRWQEFAFVGPDGQEGETDSTVYSVAGKWSPVDDVQLRGTFATAFRNPSFVQLFYPATQAFVSGVDPCDNRSVTEGPAPAVRAANCAAEGINTSTFVSNIQNATIQAGRVIGNEGLQPEETRSYSFGGTFSPRWVDGLDIAVDYYWLEIEEQINFLEFEDLAAVCYDSTDFPNEEACGTFVRDENFQVQQAEQTWQNASFSTFEAVTIRAFYGFDTMDLPFVNRDFGRLSFDSFTQHNITNELQATPGAEFEEDVGDFADPTWSGYFDTAWDYENFRLTHRVVWQNEVELDALEQGLYARDFVPIVDGDPTMPGNQAGYSAILDNDTDARAIHQLGAAYTINDRYTIQGNILNLTDRQPNRLQQAANHFTSEESLGRRYLIRLVGRF